MSLVENPFCQLCQVAFDSAGDPSLHSCADIKQEIQDYELPTNVKLNVDFKVETDYDFDYFDLDLSEEFLTAILKQVSMTSVMKF